MTDILRTLTADGKIHITSAGCIVSEDLIIQRLGAKVVSKLLANLTIKPKVLRGYRPPTILYKRLAIGGGASVLVLPRDVAWEFGRVIGVQVDFRGGIDAPIQFAGELSPNQQLIVDHLMASRFVDRMGSATLDFAAGGGKTALSLALASKLGYRTLYVVKGRPLQKQAVGEAKQFCPTASVCSFEGKKYKSDTNYDIVVIVVNSALLQSREFFGKFGFVIVDEIHLFCSAVRSKLFWELSVPCMLAMSGTTGERQDEMDVLYERHFGNVIASSKLPGYVAAEVKFEGTIDVVRWVGDPKYLRVVTNEITGDMSAVETIGEMIKCPARTQFIVDELVKEWRDPSRHIIAFAEHRAYLTKIAELIRREIGVDPLIETEAPAGTPADTLMGADGKDAAAVAAKSRIILTTYGYGGTGLSIKELNTEFLLTPRRNGHRQFLARITRRNGDPTVPRKVVDVWDIKSALKSQFYGRTPAFTEVEWPMIQRTVKHSDIKVRPG